MPPSTSKKNKLPLGIDIVEVKKAKSFYAAHGHNLASLFFPDEVRRIRRSKAPHETLALFFAAKEAVFKAMGREWMGREGFKKIHIFPGKSRTFGIRLESDFKDRFSLRLRGVFLKNRHYRVALVNVDEKKRALL